jgi:predicted hydrolase (HD superfamily)
MPLKVGLGKKKFRELFAKGFNENSPRKCENFSLQKMDFCRINENASNASLKKILSLTITS